MNAQQKSITVIIIILLLIISSISLTYGNYKIDKAKLDSYEQFIT